MRSIASSRDGVALDDQSLKRALKQGLRLAIVAVSALEMACVELLRDNQPRGLVRTVSYAETRMSKPAFRLYQVLKPQRTLTSGPDYCLR